jgi:hypothetical protein
MWLACNNVVVDGLAFNYNNSGAWIRLWDNSGTGNNITIQNCSFRNLNATAVYGSSHDNLAAIELHENSDTQGSNLTVYNCYFNTVINGDNAVDNLAFNANCIGGFNYINILVDHCEFTNAFSAFYPKAKCGPYVFSNNFVHDCEVMIRDANENYAPVNSPQAAVPRCVTRNNVAYNVGGLSSGDAAYPGQVNVDIYNNTICFTGNNARQFQAFSTSSDADLGTSPSATTSTFYNNILFNLTSSAVPTYWFAGNGTQLPYNKVFALMDYNCHDPHGFQFTDLYSNTTLTSLASWRSYSGYDTHSAQANPMFAGTPSRSDPTQVKLASNSPGKGTGRTTGTSSGSACDMGAWGGANPPTQIGCNLSQLVAGPPPPAVPMAPTLSVS